MKELHELTLNEKQALAKKAQAKYIKRSDTIKSSNFDFNLSTCKAYSYDWWCFVTKVNGLVIFNQTTYSQTTCRHQSKALRILDYKYDLKLNFTRKNLNGLESALNNEIENCKHAIKELIATIRKPRTRKKANDQRRMAIRKLVKHINKVREVKKVVL